MMMTIKISYQNFSQKRHMYQPVFQRSLFHWNHFKLAILTMCHPASSVYTKYVFFSRSEYELR